MPQQSSSNRINASTFSLGSTRLATGGAVGTRTPNPHRFVTTRAISTSDKNVKDIIKSLNDIIKILDGRNKAEILRRERQRRFLETQRRKRKEAELEKGGRPRKEIIPPKLMAPIKNILGRIVDFIVKVLIGKTMIKMIDWFSDRKNQSKVKAIVRFFKDYWPLLLTLYLRFGTSLGRFIGRLGGVLAKGIFRLGAFAARLAAKAGISGAGRFARFLGGRRGKAIATLIGIGADVAITAGAEKFIGGYKGIEGDKQDKPKPKVEGRKGGGFIRFPRFSGGGYNQLRNILAFKNGSIVTSPGFVSGEKGIDKVPAMLSDGEFVMSRGAVQKFGVDTLEQMNAEGGGTNRPRVVSGNIFAAGGGLIGESKDKLPSIKLSPLEIKFAARANQRGITNPIELKAFLSQVNHESGGDFSKPRHELYNKSPNDPPGKPGYEYFRGYTGMIGNKTADDAYNYRGRGYLQITGRDNYANIGKRIGVNLLKNPDLMMNSDVALNASIEYWKTRVRPMVKNWANIFDVSRAVNKPTATSPSEIMGMTEREKTFNRYNSIPNNTFISVISPQKHQKKEEKSPSFMETVSGAISGMFNKTSTSVAQNKNQIKIKREPVSRRANSIQPPTRSNTKVVRVGSSSSTKPNLPVTRGTPNVPSFDASHPSGHGVFSQILGILGVK